MACYKDKDKFDQFGDRMSWLSSMKKFSSGT